MGKSDFKKNSLDKKVSDPHIFKKKKKKVNEYINFFLEFESVQISIPIRL